MSIQNEPLLREEGFFDRICEALGIKNERGAKSKVAEIVGVSDNAIGLWEKGEMPGRKSLENIALISKRSNASIHWLLTGEGEKSLNPSKQGFGELFDIKLKESIREEIIKGAVTVRNILEETVEYEVLNSEFDATCKEILAAVALRIRDAVKTIDIAINTDFQKPFFESSAYIGKAVGQMEAGEIPSKQTFRNVHHLFSEMLQTLQHRSLYRIEWLLTGEGEKTCPTRSALNEHKVEKDEILIKSFLENINQSIIRERKVAEVQEKTLLENNIRQLVREIVQEVVQEELNNKRGAPSFTIGRKSDEEGRRIA
jgi:transcriptional regulator with XRE-family HTH domain